MSRSRNIAWAMSFVIAALANPTAVRGQSSAEPDLYKAYFLEREAKEYAAASELYRNVVARPVSEEVKRIARTGAERCRDHLAAEDFSKLMPADAVAYVELNRPGQLVEKLAGMLGLTAKDMQQVLAARPSQDSRAIAHIPGEIKISPAIFEHLGAFGGAALALTDFDVQSGGPPSGLLVIHHGDALVLKGLLETAFQFAPTAEKIRDLATFGANLPEVGRITGVLTEGLFIVGTGRELVEGAVDRLLGSGTDSLGARADLAEIAAQKKGATLFAYCDLQGLVKRITAGQNADDNHEMRMIDGLVDFDSLRWASLSLGINDGILGLQFAVRLADDHRCIAYNLMRMPPMTRQCLANVPADAAAFFGIGLNPAMTSLAADAAKGQMADSTVTGFDIFREFFGNIREICGFVIPGEFTNGKMPNAGILMAVNNPAKSRALWDQFLSMPGMMHSDKPAAPKPLSLGGVEATAYTIPEVGKVYLAQLDDCMAIALTRSALKAAIRAHDKKESILGDAVMAKVVERMPPDSSLMVAGHFGRLAKVAAGACDEMASNMQANMAAELCSETVAWAGLGQAPNQLTLRVYVSGLPNLNNALKKFAPMINGFLPAAAPTGGKSEELVRAARPGRS